MPIKSNKIRRLLYLAASYGEPVTRLFRSEPQLPQQIIYTVTNGRSGSGYLAHMFESVTSVHAEHECLPTYHPMMHDVQFNQELAKKFIRALKLPQIADATERSGKPVYVETSHLFCKGYYEAYCDLGLPLSLIILRRDARAIAQSLLRIETVPDRTKSGRKFLLGSKDKLMLPLPESRNLSDYQLCYWQCMETEARQKAYAADARARGLRVAETDMAVLTHDEGEFERILKELAVPYDDDDLARIHAAQKSRINAKSEHVAVEMDADSLAEQEREVRALLGLDQPRDMP